MCHSLPARKRGHLVGSGVWWPLIELFLGQLSSWFLFLKEKKSPTSVACLSFQCILPGVGNEHSLPLGEERRVSGGVNVFNSLGPRAGCLALKLSNFYLGRTTFKIFILNIEKDLSKKKKFLFSSSPFTLYTMRKNSLKKWFSNCFLNQRNILFFPPCKILCYAPVYKSETRTTTLPVDN